MKDDKKTSGSHDQNQADFNQELNNIVLNDLIWLSFVDKELRGIYISFTIEVCPKCENFIIMVGTDRYHMFIIFIFS